MSEPTPPRPAVPEPTPHPYSENEVRLVLETHRHIDPYYRDLMAWLLTALDAERRRAEVAEEQRDAMIGMDEAGVNTLLERWDQTAPHVQRGIVAKFMAMLHENAEEAKGWRKAIEEMSDAGATACQAAAKLTEERDALRQEVAGLRAGLKEAESLLVGALPHVATVANADVEDGPEAEAGRYSVNDAEFIIGQSELFLAHARQLLDRPA